MSRCRSSPTRHGNAVHLGERDCSMQRRHQKIIEEAPVARRVDASCARAWARPPCGWRARSATSAPARSSSCSTPDGDFYFMEMNTRLQVEHPVTEAITGLDLVEWQLRVARGEPLPLRAGRHPLRGHAIEARLCAEDACAGFVPQAGRVRHWCVPAGEGVRIDHGLSGAADDPAALRLDDRQGHRLWRRPRAGARPAAARAGRQQRCWAWSPTATTCCRRWPRRPSLRRSWPRAGWAKPAPPGSRAARCALGRGGRRRAAAPAAQGLRPVRAVELRRPARHTVAAGGGRKQLRPAPGLPPRRADRSDASARPATPSRCSTTTG